MRTRRQCARRRHALATGAVWLPKRLLRARGADLVLAAILCVLPAELPTLCSELLDTFARNRTQARFVGGQLLGGNQLSHIEDFRTGNHLRRKFESLPFHHYSSELVRIGSRCSVSYVHSKSNC
jgi:hypothetical protein